ncbi:MAG TPA: DsbA family oxidoreductase [Acidimicrobiales bacterium]|nr:DsbA family oxidoreductase [Acidimicrobiales bacterium]
MRVDIWSDVVCPWCYIGKRRMEDALSRFDHAADIDVVWRAFELNPSAPATYDGDNTDRLARKYGVSRAEAEAMNERVTRIADDEGLAFRLDIARPGNTFDAHRLLHLAAERGRQDELKEELLAAYQARAEAIGDHEVLVKAAVTTGLDEVEVRAVLQSDRYGDDVRADERAAQEIGVTGVPFFVFDGRYAVSGAQSSDVLLEVLQRAWTERPPVQVVAGDACGPEGCEVPAS